MTAFFSPHRRACVQALLLAASVAAAAPAGAQADAYPSKTVTLVVPYAAGGPTDATARRLAELMGKALGGQVVVENKTGAATIVAAEYVARAPKDGYTLLISPGTTTSANPHLYRKLPYKIEDFAPITLLSRQPWVMTAGPASKARDFAAFDRFAKAQPGGVSFGTTGVGSLSHIVGDWIGRTVGWKMNNVPYKGSAASVADLLGGRIDSQLEAIASGLQLDQGGKAKVIAVLDEQRAAVLPQVPTFKELGYPDLVAYVTFGLMAPAGTPEPVLDKLFAAAQQALRDPGLVAQMAKVGEVPVPSASRQAYAQLVRDEHVRWGKIIAPLGVQLD